MIKSLVVNTRFSCSLYPNSCSDIHGSLSQDLLAAAGIPYNGFMSKAHGHTIHRHHFGWDHGLTPAAHIAPGESLEFDVSDASGGQLGPTSTVSDVVTLDFSKINPV